MDSLNFLRNLQPVPLSGVIFYSSRLQATFQMAGKRIGIIQSNYIPWKGYFDFINSVDEFVILDDVRYTKSDWRNRNRIKGPAGLHWLSIPVKAKSDQIISDTVVSDLQWSKKHWETIRHFYRASPYFLQYQPEIENLYRSCTQPSLSEINYHFIKGLNNILGINTPILGSRQFQTSKDKNYRIVDICKALGADEYLTGPNAKGYIDEALFSSEKIRVKWMDYSKYVPYNQLFPPFAHNVSIIDLLFNTGDHFPNYMISFNQNGKS